MLKRGCFFDWFNRNFDAFRDWYQRSTAWFLQRTWGTMIAYAGIVGGAGVAVRPPAHRLSAG